MSPRRKGGAGLLTLSLLAVAGASASATASPHAQDSPLSARVPILVVPGTPSTPLPTAAAYVSVERLQQQRRQVPAVLGVGPDANAARTSVQLSDAASAGQQEDYEDADDEDDPYDDDDDDDSSEESGSGQPELGVRSLAAQNGPGAEAVQPAAAAAAALRKRAKKCQKGYKRNKAGKCVKKNKTSAAGKGAVARPYVTAVTGLIAVAAVMAGAL